MPSAERLLPAGESSSSANSGHPKGIRKINDAVYLLSEPEGSLPDIEIVFIHGLQFIDHSDAFWKTWTAGKDQDGKEVCWPMAWLAEDFPSARILSVSYDSSAIETSDTGRIDLFLAGESLVQSMVDLADVGQHGCPVVFVCLSLGGLVAKQIVLNAHRKFSKERKYVDFLNNIGGFHFYATPHSGSRLADLASYLPIWRNKSPMMKILKVINDDLGRLNEEFDRFVSANEWKFAVVAETHKTSLYGFSAKLVEETSARYTYNKFISVQADHFGVCKPESQVSSSYLYLRNLLAEVVQQNVLRNSNVWGLPSFLVGMEDRLAEVISKLEVHSRVGLVGMGGIGKTTLSKHLYNQKRSHFDKCCFLEDVKSIDIKISYDDLDEHLQSLFVDFACTMGESLFLYGSWEKTNLMELKDRFGRIWGDATGIHHLISRSLIKWNLEKETFVMHDQLCDLGKSIGNTSRIRCRGALYSGDILNLEWYEIFDEIIIEVILKYTFNCIDKLFCYIFQYCLGNYSYDTKEWILIIIKWIGTLWVLYYHRWYIGVLIWITIGTVYTYISVFSYFKDSYSTWEESEGLKLMLATK